MTRVLPEELLIREATTEADLALGKALVMEYAESLGLDLSFSIL